MPRSGMMGCLTIMQDTRGRRSSMRLQRRSLRCSKSDLRPLIRDADLCHLSERPDGVHWDGIESFDRKRGRGAVYAFRGTTADEADHVFRLQGVLPNRWYRVRFHDGTSVDRTIDGRELLRGGIPVHLPQPNSSELILFEETGSGAGGALPGGVE